MFYDKALKSDETEMGLSLAQCSVSCSSDHSKCKLDSNLTVLVNEYKLKAIHFEILF